MVLNHKNVKTYKEVFVVEFQDGNVEGSKYVVRCLHTNYMGFHASPFEKYYTEMDEALLVAKDMNKE